MISHKHKCIFVHIPKTAGASIADMIWARPRSTSELWGGFVDRYRNKYQTGGLQHLRWHQIRLEVGADIFNEYFKFTFVRNPWDKVVSQYRYLAMRGDLLEYFGFSEYPEFETYLDSALQSDHVQVADQSSFIVSDAGEYMVDFIGRFESLHCDARKIFKKIGVNAGPFPHVNRSDRHQDFRKYYTAKTKAMVAERYKTDIERFGYYF